MLKKMCSWYRPKSVQLLRKYSLRSFGADLVAGVTVGLVALPLAMAFGIASGVTPQAGIYTAIIAGLIVSILGGSRVQIGGPTGAFVVVVSSIIAAHGFSGLLMVTMMAGIILILLGATGMGAAISYIPRPVVVGFTNGIAVLIALSQVKDFLGLRSPALQPGDFCGKVGYLAQNIGTFHWPSLLLGCTSLALIICVSRYSKRVPGSIIALIGATIAVYLFNIPVETIGSKFGGIPLGLPGLQMPSFRADLIVPLLPSAITVALLAAIESLLSAVVADSMCGDEHDSNVELVAQGVANLTVPLFAGIPVTGAIARTATNIRCGAQTPVAGIVHALTLLLIVLLAAPLAKFIPLCTLAAILFVVAYNMGEWKEIKILLKMEPRDVLVWVVTFVLTVVADLTTAVEVGIVLAALLYIYQVSHTTIVAPLSNEDLASGRNNVIHDFNIPHYVRVIHIQGPLLFGGAEKLRRLACDGDPRPVVILRLRHMTAIDASGLYAIEQFARRMRASGRTLILTGARRQPKKLLYTSSIPRVVGARNILPNIESAFNRAKQIFEGFGGMADEIAEELT